MKSNGCKMAMYALLVVNSFAVMSCLYKNDVVDDRNQHQLFCSEYINSVNSSSAPGDGNLSAALYYPIGITPIRTPDIWELIGQDELSPTGATWESGPNDESTWLAHVVTTPVVENLPGMDAKDWFLPTMVTFPVLDYIHHSVVQSFAKKIWQQTVEISGQAYELSVSQSISDEGTVSARYLAVDNEEQFVNTDDFSFRLSGLLKISRDAVNRVRNFLISIKPVRGAPARDFLLSTRDASYQILDSGHPVVARGVALQTGSNALFWLVGIGEEVELQVGYSLKNTEYTLQISNGTMYFSKVEMLNGAVTKKIDCRTQDVRQAVFPGITSDHSPIVPATEKLCKQDDVHCLKTMILSLAAFWNLNRIGEKINYGIIEPVPCDIKGEITTVRFGVGDCSFTAGMYLPSEERVGLDRVPASFDSMLLLATTRGVTYIDGVNPNPVPFQNVFSQGNQSRYEIVDDVLATSARDLWYLFDYRSRPFHLFSFYSPYEFSVDTEEAVQNMRRNLRAAVMWWPND